MKDWANSESLKNTQQFSNVYNKGKYYANKYLVMYVLENDLPFNRVGISVSKKVGNSVVRHRLARLIRETYRLNTDMFNSGLNIIVIARTTAKGKNFAEIESAFLHLCRMHKIAVHI